MGVFAGKDLNKARTSSGGNYITEEGSFDLEIVGWKSFYSSRSKETSLIVDLKILSSSTDAYRPGQIKNFYAGENDDMFDLKAKNICVAAYGLIDGQDSALIEAEDWGNVLEASVKSPLFLGRKIRCEAVRMLKKDGKKQAKADPTLLDDAAWYKRNSFVRVEFFAHPEQRELTLKKAEAAKASAKK